MEKTAISESAMNLATVSVFDKSAETSIVQSGDSDVITSPPVSKKCEEGKMDSL